VNTLNRYDAHPERFGETHATVAQPVKIECDLTVHQQDDQIVRMTSPLDPSVTHGNLCIKGSFGWQYVQIQAANTKVK
jgi:predicted molibdopterin-dependent oxidoreductase YjgC